MQIWAIKYNVNVNIVQRFIKQLADKIVSEYQLNIKPKDFCLLGKYITRRITME